MDDGKHSIQVAPALRPRVSPSHDFLNLELHPIHDRILVSKSLDYLRPFILSFFLFRAWNNLHTRVRQYHI